MLALQLALQDDLICGQFLPFYSHCSSPIHATVRAPTEPPEMHTQVSSPLKTYSLKSGLLKTMHSLKCTNDSKKDD